MNQQEALSYYIGFPGVLGGVMCNLSGKLIASEMPSAFNEEHQLQLARKCGMISKLLTNKLLGCNDLFIDYSEGSVFLSLTENHLILTFLDKGINKNLVKMSSKVIYKKFEPQHSSGGIDTMIKTPSLINQPAPTAPIVPAALNQHTSNEESSGDGIWG